MKLRFPLFAKILLWFFLNLLLLGAVFYIFVRIQFRVGLDSLLAGPTSERIDAVSRLICDDLRDAPRENWTDVLKRFNAAYNIHFSSSVSTVTNWPATSSVCLPKSPNGSTNPLHPNAPDHHQAAISVHRHRTKIRHD